MLGTYGGCRLCSGPRHLIRTFTRSTKQRNLIIVAAAFKDRSTSNRPDINLLTTDIRTRRPQHELPFPNRTGCKEH
ncbi:hypothetical protein KC323_g25 [Hortaea werneckii]|nr:hypothetical protein KC323_g25 [Hortaea werneckii]